SPIQIRSSPAVENRCPFEPQRATVPTLQRKFWKSLHQSSVTPRCSVLKQRVVRVSVSLITASSKYRDSACRQSSRRGSSEAICNKIRIGTGNHECQLPRH
ncbi:hypothetical protein RvY_09508, partial [Ramazzottius varieornatus]